MAEEVNAEFTHGFVGESLVVIRMPNFQLVNPLNGSQGFSKAATFAAAKRRKWQRFRTKLEVQSVMFKWRSQHAQEMMHIKKVKVFITRVSLRKFDAWDALPASLKSVIDGIADAFGKRDDDALFEWMQPKQSKGKKGEHEIIIVLELHRVV